VLGHDGAGSGITLGGAEEVDGPGGLKISEDFSAAAKSQRFFEHEQITQRHNTRREEAHLRSVLGDWSHVPLVTIPKLDVGKWQDGDFLFYFLRA
jgi:thiamine phosphate synthase YjbQ (UPF0047 family)